MLVEKASVTPGDYLSVYSRSGERLDLAFVLTRKNDEARG